MEITSRLLLKSAEYLVKKKESQASSIDKDKPLSKIETNEKIYNKIQKFYDNLKDVQNQFSKEQTRLEYLTKQPELINQNLKFNSEILFPEYNENWNPKEVLQKTQKKLEELKYKIKQLEIEQENYFASSFISPSEIQWENFSIPFSKIEPKRVSELTRNEFMA